MVSSKRLFTVMVDFDPQGITTGAHLDTGSLLQVEPCYLEHCGGCDPCHWGEWRDWSDCDVHCGGGLGTWKWPIPSMGLVYLPRFGLFLMEHMVNVGKYTIHDAMGEGLGNDGAVCFKYDSFFPSKSLNGSRATFLKNGGEPFGWW